MNENEIKMIKEKCEHFNEEVCSKINCKGGCKYYGTANCDNCIHEDVCYMLEVYNDCKNEVAEYGCDQYQPKVVEDEIVIKKSKYEELRNRAEEVFNEMTKRMKAEIAIERKMGKHYVEQAKQETAREILQELYDEAMRYSNEVVELTAFEIKQLAKEKGIELE